jgi:hypothetical protein
LTNKGFFVILKMYLTTGENMYNELREAFNYTNVEDRISSLGYQNPLIDKGDSRQREAWMHIRSLNLSVKMVNIKSLIGSVASHEDRYFANFQCRVTSESDEKVGEYEEEMFIENKKLRRLPFVFKINEKYYISIGNHRIRAILGGFKKYPNSLFVGHCILVDCDNSLSDNEKVDIGSDIANMSNKDTGDETQAETAEDIAHQIITKFQIKSKLDTSLKFYTEQQKMHWADSWCTTWKPNTSSRKISRAKNIAFANHISQSVPFQDDTDLNIQWRKYWPHSSWNPDISKVQQKKYATHPGNFQKTMMYDFLTRESWDTSNERIQACVRAGETLNKDITSEETIQEQRQKYIQFIESWNNNINVINSGFPIITKIMFVKQTANGCCEAWEWIEESGKLVQISRLDYSK